MIPFQRGTINVCFGPVRSGKTFTMDEWCLAENRIVRFDVTGETVAVQGWEHIWQDPRKLWERLQQNPNYFRIAYHPGSDLEDEFEWSSKALWRLRIDKMLVVDELHEICPVNSTPDWMQTMLRYARHDRMTIMGASQRIADVHKLVTSGADTTVLFKTMEARDLDAIEDRWRCSKTIENLRPLIYQDETRTVLQKPQCLVISRGRYNGQPQCWDFSIGGFVHPDYKRGLDGSGN